MPRKTLLPALGAAIRLRRRRAGLSISQMAGVAGVDPGFIAYIEAGKKAPSIVTLARIAAALDVPLGELLGAAVPDGGRSRIESRLRALWARAKSSRSHWTDVVHVLEVLQDPRKARAIRELTGG